MERLIGNTVIDNQVCNLYKDSDTYIKYIKHPTYGKLQWLSCVKHPCFDVTIKEHNYTNTKDDDNVSISSAVYVQIYINLRKVYEFTVQDMEYALFKIGKLKTDMMEHAFNFLDPDSEIGRNVYYKGQPGSVTRLMLDHGAIVIDLPLMNAVEDVKTSLSIDVLDPEIIWR